MKNQHIFCALFAALIAVSNFFQIPVGPIPIVLKNMFVVLAGTVLGSFYGGVALLIFIAAGLIGIPVFVIPGGLGVFSTPLAGYIIGYFVGALTAGLVAGLPQVREKKLTYIPVIRVCAASILGFALILLCGAVYMMILRGMSFGAALSAGVVPFILADSIKLVISIPLAIALRPIAAKYINVNS